MANNTERIGVHHCGEIAEKNGWMFREQPVNDIGIDAHMEITNEFGQTKQLLALQIKSGESYFSEDKPDYVVFRGISARQYNYWTSNPLPCILVLYNPADEMCIWQKLTTSTIEKTQGGEGDGYYVKVPKDQVFLNVFSNEELLSYTTLPNYITNYNFLLSQKSFMQLIQDGYRVRLHSTEWVNKSSGKGETELLVEKDGEIKSYKYLYWFPVTPYTEVFPKLFPWANFDADEDFYEDNDEALWRELNCYYDEEDHDWCIVGDSYDEFRKKLNPMRSIDHCGEVAEYMLVLSLNELGRSFLEVDKYVSQTCPYCSTRPKDE